MGKNSEIRKPCTVTFVGTVLMLSNMIMKHVEKQIHAVHQDLERSMI